MSEWPDDFDLRDEPEIGAAVRDFIEENLTALKTYDQKRRDWASDNLPADYQMTYFFYDHTNRVAEDMKQTALHMGFSELCATNLYFMMLAHDFGKLKLPLHLWDMTDKPEDHLKQERRTHTEIGVQMARDALPYDHPFIEMMIDIMAHHHEHMDGSGYLGLSGDQLSAPVRLASIIESFDGYSIPRPHFGDRDISAPGVLERMRSEKGAAIYDMDLFEPFAQMKMMRYETQSKEKA